MNALNRFDGGKLVPSLSLLPIELISVHVREKVELFLFN